MRDGIFGLSSVLLGALAAGVSIVIVMGSILLAFSETNQVNTIADYPTLESIDILTPTTQVTATEVPQGTTASPTPSKEPTSTITLSPRIWRMRTAWMNPDWYPVPLFIFRRFSHPQQQSAVVHLPVG